MNYQSMNFQEKVCLGVSLILTNWPALKIPLHEANGTFKKN